MVEFSDALDTVNYCCICRIFAGTLDSVPGFIFPYIAFSEAVVVVPLLDLKMIEILVVAVIDESLDLGLHLLTCTIL